MRRLGLHLPWLAWRHLWSRPLYAAVSVLLMSLALAVAGLLLQLAQRLPQQLDHELQGTELLVGPRGDPWRQVLSSLLFLGEPGSSLPYEALPLLRGLPQVQQAVPVLVGPRHQSLLVLGTEPAFLTMRQARLAQGRVFEHVMEVVLGADAAQRLGLGVGAEFMGAGAQRPYVVVGVLARQGATLDGLILTDLSTLWSMRQPSGALPAGLSAGLGGAEVVPGGAPRALPASLDGAEESLGDISFVLVSPAGPESLNVPLPWLNTQGGLLAAVPRDEIGRMKASLAWLPTLLTTLLSLLLLCAWLAAFALMLQAQEQRRQDLVLLRVLGAPAWRVALLPALEWLWVSALALGMAWAATELAWFQSRRLAAPEQLHWLGTQGRVLVFGGRLAVLGFLLALAGAAWPAWCAWRLQVSRLLQPGE